MDHKWSESIGYYKAFGITEYPGGERIKEAYHALAREFQPDQYPGVSGGVAVGTAAASSSAPVAVGHVISQSQVEDSGNVSGSSVDLMVSCGPAAKAGDASLTRLIIPRQVAATAGKAVTRYVYAVAASTAGELPVTVTLKVVPVAGVRVGINPASVRKELDGRTNFCFSPRIVCTESGTWQVKWTAKIGSSKDRNTANDVLTGTTRVVCRRNAKWYDG